MRLTLLVMLAIVMTGCASIKEKCARDQSSQSPEYESYQACVSEHRARKAAFAQAWSNSFSGMSSTNNQQNMNCTQILGSYPVQYSCH